MNVLTSQVLGTSLLHFPKCSHFLFSFLCCGWKVLALIQGHCSSGFHLILPGINSSPFFTISFSPFLDNCHQHTNKLEYVPSKKSCLPISLQLLPPLCVLFHRASWKRLSLSLFSLPYYTFSFQLIPISLCSHLFTEIMFVKVCKTLMLPLQWSLFGSYFDRHSSTLPGTPSSYDFMTPHTSFLLPHWLLQNISANLFSHKHGIRIVLV